jgi:hypothetical protein
MQTLGSLVPGRISTDVALQDTAIYFNDTLNMEKAVSHWLATLDANKNFTRK